MYVKKPLPQAEWAKPIQTSRTVLPYSQRVSKNNTNNVERKA